MGWKFNPFTGKLDKTDNSSVSDAMQTAILNSIVTHTREYDVVLDGSLNLDYVETTIDRSGNVVFAKIS